jgi:hypothetical protein
MEPDPIVFRFSPDEWNKLASGLVLSPDDLSMIEAGLASGKDCNGRMLIDQSKRSLMVFSSRLQLTLLAL